MDALILRDLGGFSCSFSGRPRLETLHPKPQTQSLFSSFNIQPASSNARKNFWVQQASTSAALGPHFKGPRAKSAYTSTPYPTLGCTVLLDSL